jgi:hypothetical protein
MTVLARHTLACENASGRFVVAGSNVSPVFRQNVHSMRLRCCISAVCRGINPLQVGLGFAWKHCGPPCMFSTTPGARSFDHFVGVLQDRLRHRQAERLGGPEVDDQRVFHRLLNREVGRAGAPEDAVDVGCRLRVVLVAYA